ncbi:TPA: hypothetical protein NJ560_004496 [Vibrio parahaemolyticus]|nr:hypothetical protein [Vibrio parahaemolyticus]HCG8477016.1 hypothetical protein [Vibrio parahaemolyticus]
MTYIENKIMKLVGEARAQENHVANHYIQQAEWKASDRKTAPDHLIEGEWEYVEPYKYTIKSLYMAVVYYLDSNNLNNYLNVFYKTFGKNPNSPKYLEDFEIDHYWSGELYSVFLHKLLQFLSVFEFMESDSDRYKRLSGIRYLETVLKSTASIISKSGENPSTETQVYNAVKNTLEAIFPSSKSPKSNFIKTAKEYKPDILIPELFTAVEYKYAKDESKLKATIEQISADVIGYTGDKDYNIFYAVFYVTEDFWGLEKFNRVWQEHKFPSNWLPVYIVGK